MKTAVSKPKKPKVVADQQPKGTQSPVTQQAPRPKLSKEEIAKRAYEIYLQKGCQPGQCEQNWKQAEQELKNRK